MTSQPHFYQLFDKESSTYTYLLGDESTREAVLIDPVLEQLDRDLKLIHELKFKLKFILETHVHADHVTSASEIRTRTGALTAVSALSDVNCADVKLKEGDLIEYGPWHLRVISTPGHTKSCVCYYGNGRVFTGDTLLIRGCGRTDFQEGSSESLYMSVTQKLFRLPDETSVYPAHDYRGFTRSTIAEEKTFNPRLGGGQTLDSFVQIMHQLKLSLPAKIQESVPANLNCGRAPQN